MANRNGLNGGGFWKRFWQAAAGIVGGMVAGPLGALIAGYIVELAYTQGRGGVLPQHLEAQMDNWNNNEFTPFFNTLSATLSVSSPNEYRSEAYLVKLNIVLQNLAVLQAYYDYKATREADSDTKQLFESKASIVGTIKDTVTQSFEEIKINYSIAFSLDTKTIKAQNTTFLNPIYLTWGNSLMAIGVIVPFYYDLNAGKGGNPGTTLPTGGLPPGNDSSTIGPSPLPTTPTTTPTTTQTPPFIPGEVVEMPIKTPIEAQQPTPPLFEETGIKNGTSALKWIAGIVSIAVIYKIGKNAK